MGKRAATGGMLGARWRAAGGGLSDGLSDDWNMMMSLAACCLRPGCVGEGEERHSLPAPPLPSPCPAS